MIVTTVGMMSSIFGMSRVVNATRAAGGMLPMIGPSTRPRNRSMIVHAAPNETWRNTSGHSLSIAMPTTSATNATATRISPLRGTISKSRS